MDPYLWGLIYLCLCSHYYYYISIPCNL